MKGRVSCTVVDTNLHFKEFDLKALHLALCLLRPLPTERIHMAEALEHVLFWDKEKQHVFLQDAGGL